MKQERLTVAEVEAEVLDRLRQARGIDDEELVAEMLRTVLKLIGDKTSRGDLKVLNRTLKELRYAFKVFAPFRHIRKTSIFGSARVQENDPYYRMACEFARRLTAEGFMVITGAGDGIMGAGNRGAGKERSFGVNIRLPFEQKANRFIRKDPKLINFHFFFTRKLIFVKETDAVAFFPGGFGTHDEAIEILTLMQTGKSQIIPMVFLDLPGEGYWEAWRRFVETQLLARGYISKEDLGFFKILTDPEVAIREIHSFYRKFHSYRFVNRDLVIRLTEQPAEGLLQRLNEDFRDILSGGSISVTDPLPDELNEAETLNYHRLLVPFNRKSYARLRQLIDCINAEP
jgi:uncharacterized protein (TIGR00730 family)